MDAGKRAALEAAGWTFGDAADFLEMRDDERQLLEVRVAIALSVRRQREAAGLSQKQLGAILKTSQPRVAKIEAAAADVSLDQLVRAYAAAGGTVVVKVAPAAGGEAGRSRAQGTLVIEATPRAAAPSGRKNTVRRKATKARRAPTRDAT